MHRIIAYVAFGWLTLIGAMHFAIDVVSQYLRRKRAPGPATTLYYGLNSAYALGQVLFGCFGLLVARQSLALLGQWPALALCGAAAAAWLAAAYVFIEYKEPRFLAGIFAALVVALAVTA